ncbi:MAG: hypothetical protein NVS4B9_42340 [Ktedonobacteraceae bacterium]
MSKVFVLDTDARALDPVHPGRARILLTQGKAAVFKRYPFTVILKVAIEKPEVHSLRLKIDPGSQTSGLALVNDTTGEMVFTAELVHRGEAIKKALDQRRAVRRGRRQRKTRYRAPRFANRRRKDGWIAPSLESRVANVLTWTKRLLRLSPISAISLELVKFDLQQMANPEISGMEYQHGTLFGYELRQYLLEKWSRACSYCGAQHIALQVEHIQAKANGGTDRVSNLCLACDPCNKAKGIQDIGVFLAEKPDLLARILAQAKTPSRMLLPSIPLVTAIGFPCSKSKAAKKVKGFQTGDIVRAVVTTGTKQGVHVGRVLVRASGRGGSCSPNSDG